MNTVFAELRHSLDCYVTWSARGDEERLAKLEDWADAVYKRCKENWERKVQDSPSHLRGPNGYPGLRRTIQEAHKSLVFLLDDRAPHGLVVVCKRWYQNEMAKYLLDNAIFQDTELSWTDIMQIAADFNTKWGFPTEKGVVYNYGIWKPKKQRFRFIAGTRAMAREEGGDPRRSTGPPRQPLFRAHKTLVRILQHVEKALKEKDKLRQREYGIRAFWGIDSINAFTMLVRTHEDIVLREGQFTADFCTMYTSFPFDLMIERTITAVDEAWEFQSRQNPFIQVDGSPPFQLTLTPSGWSWDGEGYTRSQVADLLAFLIQHNYTCNGGHIKRQIKGMPMGMPAAPQIANLACYPVEKAHAYALGPGRCLTVTRFIDDFWSSGVPLPPQEAYGMAYVVTAEGGSVVYLGVKVYIADHGDDKKEVHLTVHDREEEYPYHIVRYPEFGTVAPQQQLGGVVMGRLVHCQETCSHMKDFKESVGNVLDRCMQRGYPRRLVQSVWSRFLFQRWHCTDIRVKELRAWFTRIWSFLLKQGHDHRPDPTQPTEALSSSKFIEIFGVPCRQEARAPTARQPDNEASSSAAIAAPQSTPASHSNEQAANSQEQEQDAGLANSAMAVDVSEAARPDATALFAALAAAAAVAISAAGAPAALLAPKAADPDAAALAAALAVTAAVVLSAARTPAAPPGPAAASTSSSSYSLIPARPMDIDNEEDRRLRRAEKRPRKEGAQGFQLQPWEARAAENQRLTQLPAPPPPIVALPAPEALPALPAPPSEEGMLVDPETERRKRPREEIDVYHAQPASGTEGAGAQSNEQQEDSETVEVLLAMAAHSVRSSQEVHFEDADGNVTVTRTDVVRAVKVAASQTTTVRTSQRRSTGESSQPPTKKSRPLVKDWEPDFRNQYESFKSAASNEQRKLIWTNWTKHQRSLVYAVSTVARRRLIDTWRAEEPNEHNSVEHSWVRDQTQDGDVHKNPGPPDRPKHIVRRKGVNKNQSGTTRTSRWRLKRQEPWPNPTARQARAPRATPENRVNNVMRRQQDDDVRQPWRNGSRRHGPQNRERPPGTRYDGAATSRRKPSVPAHRRASGFGHNPADSHTDNHNQTKRHHYADSANKRRQPNRSAGCRTANKTYADAVRQRNPPPPRDRRSHPFHQKRHSRERFNAPSAHHSQGACVCCGTPPRHTVSRRLARGGNPVRSSRAKEGSAPPEHRPCNGRPQGPPAQVRKHDVRKDGRQPPPVPPGQRIIAKVASLGATTGARDGDAHPKQRPRQARNSSNATSRGNWHGSGPLPMKSTRGRQDRNVAYNQATSSNATNKPGREQHKPSSKASVPNVCV